MNNANETRNSMIDVLKGIGILTVIITHFQWTASERLYLLFPFWVDPAVPIFIMISAYVYSASYYRKNMATLAECYNYRYVVDKIIRYTIPLIVAYIVEIAYWVINKSNIRFGNLVNIFLAGGVGSGSYYYPFMIQFIFVFPIIYCIVKRYDFFGVIICFFINLGYEVIKKSYGIPVGVYRILLFRYIFLMAFGCYMYVGKSRPKKWMAVSSMIMGALWLIALHYLKYKPRVLYFWGGVSLLAALWIIPYVWFLLKTPKLQKIKCKPIEFCGKASYNIFLTQMVFYYTLSDAVYKHITNRVLQLLICLSVNVIIGLVFYLVENKVTKLVIDKIRKKNYFIGAFRRMERAVQNKMIDK